MATRTLARLFLTSFILTAFQPLPVQAGLSTKNTIPEFIDVSEWVNTAGLQKKDLEGKAKLIAFASLTSPASLTAFKVWREWQSKYSQKDFSIILITSPDYDFEKSDGYFPARVQSLKLSFPAVLDKNRTLWSIYNNLSDLTCYFVDARNRIRKTQSCVENFSYQEDLIRGLIKETTDLGDIEPTDPTTFPQLTTTPQSRRPLGIKGASYRGNTESLKTADGIRFLLPEYRVQNYYYLEGDWKIEDQSVSPSAVGSSFYIKMKERDLFLLGRSKSDQPVRAIITLNAAPVPKNFLGADSKAHEGETFVDLNETRVYQIIKDWNPKKDGEVKILFQKTGADLFELDAGS